MSRGGGRRWQGGGGGTWQGRGRKRGVTTGRTHLTFGATKLVPFSSEPNAMPGELAKICRNFFPPSSSSFFSFFPSLQFNSPSSKRLILLGDSDGEEERMKSKQKIRFIWRNLGGGVTCRSLNAEGPFWQASWRAVIDKPRTSTVFPSLKDYSNRYYRISSSRHSRKYMTRSKISRSQKFHQYF